MIRGNSASGKSTVAQRIRDAYGRGVAIVGQDNLRRNVLREQDIPDGANIGLIDLTTRYALEHGFHVVLEGILYTRHYGAMLARLRADYAGRSHWYYLDVPFEETLLRHATKPQVDEYGEAELRKWWNDRDVLGYPGECVLPATATVDEMATHIMRASGLGE